MKLVEDIHNWKKWWSMRFTILSAALAAIAVGYNTLPSDWMPALPDWFKAGLAVATLASVTGAAVARVVQQSNLPPPPEK